MKRATVYVNKQRHIVVLPHELPVSMNENWPVVRVLVHRCRGVLNMRDAARNFDWGVGEDCEEIVLTREIIAVMDGASEDYAATWAFAHIDELA